MPRRGALLLALVTVFLALGAPRWLDGGRAPSASPTGFAGVCRAHGGTPAGGACTVRYGDRVYVMDAVTAHGFDADAARFNRRGCDEAAKAAQAPRFVFHADTGVCENAG